MSGLWVAGAECGRRGDFEYEYENENENENENEYEYEDEYEYENGDLGGSARTVFRTHFSRSFL